MLSLSRRSPLGSHRTQLIKILFECRWCGRAATTTRRAPTIPTVLSFVGCTAVLQHVLVGPQHILERVLVEQLVDPSRIYLLRQQICN